MRFGNWKVSESQRSLRQRSAMRPRSRTMCSRPSRLRWWLIDNPAWPPPMITVSTRSGTDHPRALWRAIREALLRFHAGLASRLSPIDELLLEKRSQLLWRRAAGLNPEPFKLLAHCRALQDGIHFARQPVDDFFRHFCRSEK